MAEKNMKKIAYVTGTRADFGLMLSILKAVDYSTELELQVYATGMHLMRSFGRTVDQVRKEFPQTELIEAIYESDDRTGMAKFTGDLLPQVVKAFAQSRPDFVLTLGDRPEMLCVALACLYLGIPTGQVHGGEKTSTVDEMSRHAITKLSQVHFPATEESAERLRKMGEDEWRIHVVGAPALDTILNEKLPTREELFTELGLNPSLQTILLTLHPVNEEAGGTTKQMEVTMAALKIFNLPVVVIYPNADAGGRAMIEVIEREKDNPLFRIYPSLNYKQFLALEREVAVWVGNSSGALIESASFKTPIVNVGTRQTGRQRGGNVIDVDYDVDGIVRAIRKSLCDEGYRKQISFVTNPWGDGKTGPRVAKILEELVIDPRLMMKRINY
jgi:GDP/UDP-N,N'-diacetylbacillosamine 2-epimerase (hydrolysing)